MADSPPVSAGPRTLFEAKNEIARLRRQLGHGPPAGKPIPGKIDPNEPIKKDYPPSDPGMPAEPHPEGPRPMKAQNLNHKALASLIERASTAQLFEMIRKSNDGRVMAAIRKELGNRGAA